MAKISLPTAVSGYNLQVINNNFDQIEAELQSKVLYRDNPSGEPNQMENDLDMNSNRILNLPVPTNGSEAARLQDVQNAISGATDANLLNYTVAGTGGIQRTIKARLDDKKTLEGFGAIGDGTANDNTAVANLVAAQPLKLYKFGPITISNNQWLDFEYQRAKSNAAVSYMVKLTNFAPSLSRVYVSDAGGSTYAFEVGASRFPRISDAWILNCSGGGITFDPGISSANKPIIRDIVIEGFTTNGINVGTNVSEINAANVYLDSGTTTVGSLAIPKRNTIGWKQDTTLGAFANGGHLLSQVTVINSEIGFHFTDAQLTTLTNCIADSTASYGLKIDGSSSSLYFNSLFVGTSMGIYVGGTCSDIAFSDLKTVLTGVIPPWGDATFYLTAGPHYDVTVADTAVVKIDGDSWTGRKQVSVAAGAILNVTGGERKTWTTNGTVAAATTIYLDSDGADATENNVGFRMPFNGYLFSLDVYADGVPGGSDTFTYTVRASSADTALVATITGAETSKRAYPAAAVFATKGTFISVKLVTSATASARRHTGNLHILGV